MFEHVLCVYPYRKDLKNFMFVPPLGLEIIGRIIEPFARRLDIVDLRTDPGQTRDHLCAATDMVCFSVNWKRRPDFIRRQIAAVPPDVLTVIGGRHATEDPGGWLTANPHLDAVVRGDGEETMEELCRGVPWDRIAGLSYRCNGRIVHNRNRSSRAVRDDYGPNRRRRRRPYEIVLMNIPTRIAFDAVSGSRGCPYNCAFCSFSRNPWGEKRKWSGRSPESIVDELAGIEAPLLGFTDDIFTHDLKRVEEICDLIIARGIHKKYVINARIEIARHPALLQKMAQAGFAILLLGIESAQDKTLRAMNKGFDTARIRKYVARLRQHAMLLNGYFILGNIGETIGEMEQIVPFAHELGLDTILLSTLRDSPYSGLTDLVARNPGYHIGANGKIYSDHCSLPELKALRRRLYHRFYSRRQILRIAGKAWRSGLLKIFLGQNARHSAYLLWAFGQAWRRRAPDVSDRTAAAPG
ncbi:MAG: radical SAM protein [Desulfobacterales bacterium]|nr:radical SAM protein [Desulfobacterales bacterium]